MTTRANTNLDGPNNVPWLCGGDGNPSNGIAWVQWSPEEQAILEESLIRFASEDFLERHLWIALELKNKTVRDVALRIKWMIANRRVSHPSSESESSVHLGSQPNVPSVLPTGNVDDVSYKATGGRTRQLLESNADILTKIAANLDSSNLQENIKLFCDTRDNIFEILKLLNDNMPPIPVCIDEELANYILPKSSMPRQQS